MFVPNFKTRSQVVSEKSLMEKKVYRHTNIRTEKAKTIYPLYTSYTGGIISTLWHFRYHAYKSSFFLQTSRDWNDLPDSPISSAEVSNDCVPKFTSLVRARDYRSTSL